MRADSSATGTSSLNAASRAGRGAAYRASPLRRLAWFWCGVLCVASVGAVTLQVLGPPQQGVQVSEAVQQLVPTTSAASNADAQLKVSGALVVSVPNAPPASAPNQGVNQDTASSGAGPAVAAVASLADAAAPSGNAGGGVKPSSPQDTAAATPAPMDERPSAAPPTDEKPASPALMNAAASVPHAPETQQAVSEAAQEPAQTAAPPAILEPEMAALPGGVFRMGSNEDRSERPLHVVTVAPFRIAKHATTIGEWQQCVDARACTLVLKGKPDQPVTDASWDDAQQFVAWLSSVTNKHYRLPTEAEWEYAARAGTDTRYSWGNAMLPDKVSCKDCATPINPQEPPAVNAYPPNWFGLYGMGGGVAEWVADCWHNDYQNAPRDGSAAWDAPDCRRRVLRGGSWMDGSGDQRVSSRDYYDASVRYPTHGFRVAQSE